MSKQMRYRFLPKWQRHEVYVYFGRASGQHFSYAAACGGVNFVPLWLKEHTVRPTVAQLVFVSDIKPVAAGVSKNVRQGKIMWFKNRVLQ